jgi:phosphoglycolate phosphatase-like HAD superfamily hydrolase
MKLAVFDLDGTLLKTGDVDARCYTRSVVEVFGIENPSND